RRHTMALEPGTVPHRHERDQPDALAFSCLAHAQRVVEAAVALVCEMEARILSGFDGGCGNLAIIREQKLDRLFVGAEIERDRLLVVRTLGDPPDATAHLLDLNPGAFSELTDEQRIKGNLDA